MAKKKTAIIIGAGPAGLTAAYELLTRTDIRPVVLERDPRYVGGISRTVDYKGNKIDIGGHRFFSKSDKVMQWWAKMLPVKLSEGQNNSITYQRTTRALTEGLPRAGEEDGENVMYVRPRKTRILYGGNFYAYPVELSFDTLRKLGPVKVFKIGVTYVWAALLPRRPEKTLEDFFINRFGRELYLTFFKSYTEKVWGVPCRELSAEWGAQRIKGLSIMKAVQHAAKKALAVGPLSGKKVETSLIEQFLYPTYGPGFMWETVAKRVQEMGGEIIMGAEVVGIEHSDKSVKGVRVREGGKERSIMSDYVFSTTDVRSLATMFTPPVPDEVSGITEGLQYRDFLTVGLLLKEPPREKGGKLIHDTWMYIHEPDVRVGRIQLFHNWHPLLLADASRGWVGLEYFCNESDELWNMSDEELIKLGARELESLGLCDEGQVVDGTVIRQPKAYPGYFGSYDQFPAIRDYFDGFANLFLIGRNGMHRY
ncbi:MAG: NAD(P)/FAD-dependent oxidoreductase [bacterium]|nr:NAD(P)/FAD-dependent oxidoreductase [bacterium]